MSLSKLASALSSKATSLVKSYVGSTTNAVKSTVESVNKSIKNTISSSASSAIGSLRSTVSSKVSSTVNSYTSSFNNAVSSLSNDAQKGVSNSIASYSSNLISSSNTAISSASSQFKNWLNTTSLSSNSKLSSFVNSGIDTLTSSLQNTVSAAITNGSNTLTKEINSYISNADSSVRNNVNSLINQMQSEVSSSIDKEILKMGAKLGLDLSSSLTDIKTSLYTTNTGGTVVSRIQSVLDGIYGSTDAKKLQAITGTAGSKAWSESATTSDRGSGQWDLGGDLEIQLPLPQIDGYGHGRDGGIFDQKVVQELNDQQITNSEIIGLNGVRRDVIEEGESSYYNSMPHIYTDFLRYYHIYPDEEASGFYEYVFIVRPDLNIISDETLLLNNVDSTIGSDPVFNWLNQDSPGLLLQLCNSAYKVSGNRGRTHDFLSFLVGRTESYSVSDYSLSSYEDSQVFTGYKFVYPGNALSSQSGVSFSLSFRDDKDIHITKMFYAWCYYIDGLLRGNFAPKSKYIGTKVADYMTSVYYIVCGPDASEILFWQKITGAFPTSVPLNILSMNAGGGFEAPKVDIPFSGAAVESLNPMILTEFNHNTGLFDMKSKKSNLPTSKTAWMQQAVAPVHKQLDYIEHRVGKPFIASVVRNNILKYYLEWRPRNEEDN